MSIPLSQTPLPHDLLWFPGGDVVLSTDTFLFKVHKDVLSLQSSFFKDTFDFFAVRDAQMANNGSGSAEETYEGIPVMRMVGDEGTDVVHLLRTVYERQYYRRDDPETPLETIVSLLDLSTKYDFKHIRADVIVQISKEYPSNLDAYEKLDEDEAPLFGKEREYCHFTLLKALFKSNVRCLLPVVYYACSGPPFIDILMWACSLDRDCMNTLIKGKAELGLSVQSSIGVLPDLVRDLTFKCDDECHFSFRITGLDDILGSSELRRIRGDDVVEHCVMEICEECEKKVEAEYDIKRRDLWEKVPSIFGFVSWEKTRQELAEA